MISSTDPAVGWGLRRGTVVSICKAFSLAELPRAPPLAAGSKRENAEVPGGLGSGVASCHSAMFCWPEQVTGMGGPDLIESRERDCVS